MTNSGPRLIEVCADWQRIDDEAGCGQLLEFATVVYCADRDFASHGQDLLVVVPKTLMCLHTLVEVR